MALREKLQNGHEVDPELICGICHDILKKPSLIPKCQHVFCDACIQRWLKEAPERNCPVDRMFVKDLVPAPRLYLSCIEKIRVECLYRHRGCPEYVSLKLTKNHEEICQFRPRAQSNNQTVAPIEISLPNPMAVTAAVFSAKNRQVAHKAREKIIVVHVKVPEGGFLKIAVLQNKCLRHLKAFYAQLIGGGVEDFRMELNGKKVLDWNTPKDTGMKDGASLTFKRVNAQNQTLNH